jgi:hypothetical protein
VYRLRPSAPLTAATESSWLPTPSASTSGYNRGGGAGRVGPIRPGLRMMASKNMWPTPRARDHKGKGFPDQLPNAVGGQLNPTWVEWLMGFPLGHTDLER